MNASTTLIGERESLLCAYRNVRTTSVELCKPLAIEDMVIQTMPDVSPIKWHLAHVTWFFETLILQRNGRSYRPFDGSFAALFNSYYQSLGDPYPRDRRGLLSRPTVDEVRAYRRHVDTAMLEWLANEDPEGLDKLAPVVTIGLHHEQQHQELMLMDAKHVLAQNLQRPAYSPLSDPIDIEPTPLHWLPFDGGHVDIGHEGPGFAFDNEKPRHNQCLNPFQLASRPINCAEYQAFMDDGGYERPELWLADGWALANRGSWRAPMYWERNGDDWQLMTLSGLRPIERAEPVCHISFYEADAYATWTGCRLPTEFEWEHASKDRASVGNFLESGRFHPGVPDPSLPKDSLGQLFGDVWEWTTSPYAPYPGYEPFAGELGEYNGKFMINQLVLRGGCCVTPQRHLRPTYRNFYYPGQRWMFAGVRLAR